MANLRKRLETLSALEYPVDGAGGCHGVVGGNVVEDVAEPALRLIGPVQCGHDRMRRGGQCRRDREECALMRFQQLTRAVEKGRAPRRQFHMAWRTFHEPTA